MYWTVGRILTLVFWLSFVAANWLLFLGLVEPGPTAGVFIITTGVFAILGTLFSSSKQRNDESDTKNP